MVYECDQCSKALPPGVMACPSCGETFEDVVPADAEVPKRGFTAVNAPATIVLDNPLVPAQPSVSAQKLTRPTSTRSRAVSPSRSTSAPSGPSSSGETVYLQNADVTVTSARIVLSGKTYATANVTSVSKVQLPADNAGGCVGLALGVIIAFCGGAASSNAVLITGLAITILALIIMSQKKPKFLVRIVSASSESNALWSYRTDYIQGIVDAINQAIVERG